VHGVRDVRQSKIQTAEPLVPEPIACEVERAIEKLKWHNSPLLIEFQQNRLKQEVG
jgi:hypothetical protein